MGCTLPVGGYCTAMCLAGSAVGFNRLVPHGDGLASY